MFKRDARAVIVRAFLFLALLGLALAAGDKSTIKGVITDSMCATGDHSGMRMGDNDAECTKACVEAHGATYVLFDGKSAWNLSDQTLPEKFAGKKVAVTGTVDEKQKIIRVEKIAAN